MLAHATRVSRRAPPSALDPAAMVAASPTFLGFGETDLPDDPRFPDAAAWRRLHGEVCALGPACGPSCAGFVAGRILQCGWRVPFRSRPHTMVRGAAAHGGARACEAVAVEFDKLLAAGAVAPLPAGTAPQAFVPIHAVLKDEAWHAAAAAAGCSVSDMERRGVDEALRALAAAGLPRPKVRPVCDFRRDRWNEHLERFPFSLPSLSSAVDLVAACADPFLAVVDLRGFFLKIRTTADCWPYMCVREPRSGRPFAFVTAAFGTSASPGVAAFISGCIAELARQRHGLRLTVFLDDFALVADGPQEAAEHERLFLQLLADLRFEIAEEKRVPMRKAARYLGFDLTILAPPDGPGTRPAVRIAAPLERVQRAAAKVVEALAAPSSDYTRWMSLCGTLMSPGWLHTLPLFAGVSRLTSAERLRRVVRSASAVEHLRWWQRALQEHLDRGEAPWQVAVPMLEEAELLQAPLLLTDSSGDPDKGFGGHSEDFAAEFSVPWAALDPADKHDTNMTANELAPVAFALENLELSPRRLLVCLTDNVGAALAISGQASLSTDATRWLQRILARAAVIRATVAGAWIPRELNSHADALAGLTRTPSAPSQC